MKVMIQRKLVSGLITAVVSSYIFSLIDDGHSSFIIYFAVFAVGCLIIGVPCSIVAELIVLKIKRRTLSLLVGGTIHLLFGGIVIFILVLDEQGGLSYFINYSKAFIIAVIMSAIGLWLIDTVLKFFLSKYK